MKMTKKKWGDDTQILLYYKGYNASTWVYPEDSRAVQAYEIAYARKEFKRLVDLEVEER